MSVNFLSDLFGAFIPQFIDPADNPVFQILFNGLSFMVIGAVFNGAYAVEAGRAGKQFAGDRVRVLERVSGTCLIGGGIWLLLVRVQR